jgi:hypothetical protein
MNSAFVAQTFTAVATCSAVGQIILNLEEENIPLLYCILSLEFVWMFLKKR